MAEESDAAWNGASRGNEHTCQDFFDRQTALRKGSSAGTPSAEATTENARAVVLRTYSSMLSMSGRMAAIMVARPAALDRLAMISRPAHRILSVGIPKTQPSCTMRTTAKVGATLF